jgi:glyoxylase-like metal-dependent hydrolase (beta-lactamase superfamily II)
MTAYRDDEMIVERFEVGPFLVNTYIVGCRRSGQGFIVDPGDQGDEILQRCEQLGLDVTHIVNTHGHIDHIAENGYIREKTGARIIIHPDDARMLTDPHRNLSAYLADQVVSPPADLYFQEGEPFRVGELSFDVLHTPGHSPGSICLVNDRLAFVGDLLFYDSVGRSDFPGGSHTVLIQNIRRKLLPRGDEILVFPGHGPATTIGRERRENPFLNED